MTLRLNTARGWLVAVTCAGLAVTMTAASPAQADPAADIRADLQASGAPVTSVVIDNPTAASVPLDTLNSTSLTFAQLQPYFSADYTAPRAVAHITYTANDGQPLGGILRTPGLAPGGVTDLQPKMVRWRLAAVEAVKHAVAAGTSLAAFQLDVQMPAGTWSVLQELPNTSVWPPRQSQGALMTDADVQSAAARALPAWAQPLTTVAVVDDVAGERIVSADLAVPVGAFVAHNVRGVTDSLASTQRSLRSQGGNIGRTIVTISDAVSHDPLYVAADDRIWGYGSEWISPRVVGLPGFTQMGVLPPAAAPLPNPAPDPTGSSSPSVPPFPSGIDPQTPR